jgi:hypothetical protein
MLRIAGVRAVVLGALATLGTGCLVDSVDEGPTQGPDLIGRVCTAQYAVTGSFQQSKPRPVNPEDGTTLTGCWPIGVWTFQVQQEQNDCSTTPEILPQYQFRVEEQFDADGIPYQVNTYMTDPSVRHRVKVSQGGDGLCEGELNLFSADGKQVWILNPELYADNHLGGDGEYALHKSDQWLVD